MGAYLSQPVTSKSSAEGGNGQVNFGSSAMQGWRTGMEDAHLAVVDLAKNTHIFGVFDGHGGHEVARFVSRHLHGSLLETDAYAKGNFSQALIDAFLRMDELMLEEAGRKELQALARGEESIEEGKKKKLKHKRSAPQLERLESLASGQGSEEVKGGVMVDGVQEKSNDPGSLAEQESILGDEEGSRVPESSKDGTIVHAGDKEKNAVEVDEAVGDTVTGSRDEEWGGAEEAESKGGKKKGFLSNAIKGISQKVLSNSKYRGPAAGCTAVVALIQGDNLLVANAGDSRCIISRRGQALEMSKDHKPDNPEERDRIMHAGGFVSAGRVNASLNLSRAIGDMEYKQNVNLPPKEQIVTAYPEVRSLKLEQGDEFLVLACDGIWDVKTNQEVVDFVKERLQQNKQLSRIVEELFDSCIAPDTGTGLGCDNMSAIVVTLPSDLSKLTLEKTEV